MFLCAMIVGFLISRCTVMTVASLISRPAVMHFSVPTICSITCLALASVHSPMFRFSFGYNDNEGNGQRTDPSQTS